MTILMTIITVLFMMPGLYGLFRTGNIKWMFLLVAGLVVGMYIALRGMPIMRYDWRDNECYLNHKGKVEYMGRLGEDNVYMCKTGDTYYKIETPELLNTSTS